MEKYDKIQHNIMCYAVLPMVSVRVKIEDKV